MACIRGEQVGGGGMGGGGGWEAEGGLRLPLRHGSNSECPVSGINSHNPQDRPRQSLVIYKVWHHTCTSLLIPFTGSIGPVVHLHGLTGLRKALCEGLLQKATLWPYGLVALWPYK